MARLGLQRQAEAEIALEFGSDLGAISDGAPVVRDEHGSFVQGLHRADLAGVKSLNQRRDDAFGFSGERILGHQGLLFMLVELRFGLCRGGGPRTAVPSTGPLCHRSSSSTAGLPRPERAPVTDAQTISNAIPATSRSVRVSGALMACRPPA